LNACYTYIDIAYYYKLQAITFSNNIELNKKIFKMINNINT